MSGDVFDVGDGDWIDNLADRELAARGLVVGPDEDVCPECWCVHKGPCP